MSPMPRLELIKSFQFEAAHRSAHESDAACLHGHSYRVDLVVEGALDKSLGWVMDYADVSKAFSPIYLQLDHQTLNELEGLEDTRLEALRDWVFKHAKLRIPSLKDVHVEILGDCSFAPESLDDAAGSERIRFGFEAAHALLRLPEDHKCHAIHGHSFIVEVCAEDLSTLRADLQELYGILDHRCLNEIEGLENPTSEELSIWIWKWLAEKRGDVQSVLVAETCTARCIYRGE